MQNDYEFEKGQRVIWQRDSGDRVYGEVTDRTKDTVFVQLRDFPEPHEIHRGLFSRLEIA